MIKYEYTEANRLQNPHKYMYTAFQGGDFIRSYLDDRKAHIKKLETHKREQELDVVDRYLCESSRFLLEENGYSQFDFPIKMISFFAQQNQVVTEELLMSLVAGQFSGDQDKMVKYWIDFLVQRFEVTKKLYERYCSINLRKGEGKASNIRLYWLFSLLLTLYYAETKNIKYLSTVLKVNDLICSLDDHFLDKIPKQGLQLILCKEIECIGLLSKNNGDIFCI